MSDYESGKEISPTADEQQAMQAKRMSADDRKSADKKAAEEKKAAQEEFHADRIKKSHEHKKASVEKLYLGIREIEIVRKADEDDIGYMEFEACSVIKYVDNGKEAVVQDVDIKTEPHGF